MQCTAFLPWHICISLDSPSPLSNCIEVTPDRFVMPEIALTTLALTHLSVPSSIPSQTDLVILAMQREFVPSKSLPGKLPASRVGTELQMLVECYQLLWIYEWKAVSLLRSRHECYFLYHTWAQQTVPKEALTLSVILLWELLIEFRKQGKSPGMHTIRHFWPW